MEKIATGLLGMSVTLLPVMALAVVAVLIAAAVVYFRFRDTPDGLRRPLWPYAWRLLAAGVIAGWVGAALGIWFVCSYTRSNLCGLGGVFLTGPTAFVLGAAGYLLHWANGARTG